MVFFLRIGGLYTADPTFYGNLKNPLTKWKRCFDHYTDDTYHPLHDSICGGWSTSILPNKKTQSLTPLKTNIIPEKSPLAPKWKDRLPFPPFFRGKLAVSFKEGKWVFISTGIEVTTFASKTTTKTWHQDTRHHNTGKPMKIHGLVDFPWDPWGMIYIPLYIYIFINIHENPNKNN